MQKTHAYLLDAFQGRLGASFVERRDYALGNSEHLLIERDEWPDVVKAGSHLHMSAIVRGSGPRCPYCQTTPDADDVLNSDERLYW